MSKPESRALALLQDPTLLAEATNYTAASTGFPALLIEKDFFCTLLLEHLADRETGLVFKGGTCLAKVHAGFYRLSEDMDFVVPLSTDASRAARRTAVEPLKAIIAELADAHPAFSQERPLTGANRSTQYAGQVRYQSLVSGKDDQITIEVSLREPLLTTPHAGRAKTILLDPITNGPMLDDLHFPCLSLKESLAEKIRAALTRREPAIRDIYDLQHASSHLGLDLGEEAFLELVRRKLAVPEADAVDVSPARLDELRRQVDARLKQVLRPADFERFDLDQAFSIVLRIAAALTTPP